MATDDERTKPGLGLFTIPNAVTLVRLAGLPLFLYLLFGLDDRGAAAWVLAAIGVTDWLDGYLARRLHQVSTVGKVLDPTADRLVFLVAAVALVIDGSVPAWFGIATLIREGFVAIVALLLAAAGARRINVTNVGKIATLGLMLAFPLFLAGASDLFFHRPGPSSGVDHRRAQPRAELLRRCEIRTAGPRGARQPTPTEGPVPRPGLIL